MRRYVSVDELCRERNVKKWRVYELTRTGALALRHINGEPVKPYEIDISSFDKIDSADHHVKEYKRSLKIEHLQTIRGHRKENLWQK